MFPQDFRPIDLLYTISKVVEKIILDRIKEENDDKNIFLTFSSASGLNTHASPKTD